MKTTLLCKNRLFGKINFKVIVLLLCTIFSFTPFNECLSLTQTKSPTNWTDDGSTEADDEFSDPLTNLAASDDVRECLNDIDKGELCKGYLTGFGFTIPAGATINEITITMEGLWSFVADRDGYKMTIQNNSGDNYTYVDSKVEMTDSETSETYTGSGVGGAGKIFNLDVASKWTVDEINGANMGIHIEEIKSKFDNGTFCFDYIAITIDYTEVVPLPVKLLSFDVKQIDENIELTWVTGSEINNDYFTAERSSDGKQFESIGTKTGAGQSNKTIEYSMIDEHPINGIAYYRLKQTDYDGDLNYSESVVINSSAAIETTLFPNPTTNQRFFINLQAEIDHEFQVVLYSSMGKAVYTKVILPHESNSTISFDLNGTLEPGVYFLVGTDSRELFRHQLAIR